jgi:plasmid replication initiation protein
MERKIIRVNKLKNKQLVVKSNLLVEASYRLSLQEARIILLLTSMIKKNDEDFFSYKISIKDFNNFIGIKSTGNYTRTKDITRKLRERTLIIKDPEEDTELQIGWLSSIKYFNKQGFIELEFSPQLKPYLLNLKEFFTKYEIENIVKLNSSYAIRIYELLKQYEKIGYREFEIIDLKKKLNIIENKYNVYANFKRKVILQSQKELKEKTDIYFEFEEKKTGRKITGIKFLIYRKVKDKKENLSSSSEKLNLPKNIKDTEISTLSPIDQVTILLKEKFDISDQTVSEKWLKEFKDQKIIIDTINYAFQQNKEKKIDSPLGYIYMTLKNGGAQPNLKKIEQEKRKLEQRKLEREKARREELEKKYSIYANQIVNEFEKKISEEVKKEIFDKELEKIKKENPESFMKENFAKFNYRKKIVEQAQEQGLILNFEDWQKEVKN